MTEAVLLARVYYALAGVGALLVAGNELMSRLATDCAVVFSRDELATEPPQGPGPFCQQYLDVPVVAAEVLVGAVLVATALRIGHADSISRLLVPVGALIGIAVAYVPSAFIWWMITDHREEPVGPLEILLAALPFAVAVGAAGALWRAYRRDATPMVDPTT